MLTVVILVYLQYIPAPDDHKGSVQIKAKHLIHGEQPALAYAAGLAVLWCIVADAPGIELLGPAGDVDADLSRAGGNKLRRQGIGAAEEKCDVMR